MEGLYRGFRIGTKWTRPNQFIRNRGRIRPPSGIIVNFRGAKSALWLGMNKIIADLRDGTWLSPARIRRLATAALAATLLFLVFLAATSHGLNDYSGRPLGTDFSSFYAAGRLAGAGGDPYDPSSLQAAQRAIFGDNT